MFPTVWDTRFKDDWIFSKAFDLLQKSLVEVTKECSSFGEINMTDILLLRRICSYLVLKLGLQSQLGAPQPP